MPNLRKQTPRQRAQMADKMDVMRRQEWEKLRARAAGWGDPGGAETLNHYRQHQELHDDPKPDLARSRGSWAKNGRMPDQTW